MTAAPEGFLEVGRIGKPHALGGEVLVTLTTDRLERLDPGSELHDGHDVVVVDSARPHQDKYLVRFDGCVDRNGAERLRGRTLYAAPLDDESVLWVHELIGATVIDAAGGSRGVVEAVVANPAADLLQLDGGALVPLTFVVEVGDGEVHVDVPDGLFELVSGDDETTDRSG